jgi:hypothetical protein
VSGWHPCIDRIHRCQGSPSRIPIIPMLQYQHQHLVGAIRSGGHV